MPWGLASIAKLSLCMSQKLLSETTYFGTRIGAQGIKARFYPGAKPHFPIKRGRSERDKLCEWIGNAARAVPSARRRQRRPKHVDQAQHKCPSRCAALHRETSLPWRYCAEMPSAFCKLTHVCACFSVVRTWLCCVESQFLSATSAGI